jgi:hypothetical protein
VPHRGEAAVAAFDDVAAVPGGILLTLDGGRASLTIDQAEARLAGHGGLARQLDCAALVGPGTMADRPDERRP